MYNQYLLLAIIHEIADIQFLIYSTIIIFSLLPFAVIRADHF